MKEAPVVVDMRGIAKTFLTDEVETRALLGIDLIIERGDYIAIEGPSGCGKSTLLSILGLLDVPSAGAYTLNGRDVESLGVRERAAIRNREIGFIFQNFNLIGDLSIEENVELPLIYRGMTKKAREARVAEVLESVRIAHRRKHHPAQLSGGEQQRVAVARALAGSPSLLLADEPTGNLDSRNGESVMETLMELNRAGSTIVMVTHDHRFADQAKRRIVLLDGAIET